MSSFHVTYLFNQLEANYNWQVINRNIFLKWLERHKILDKIKQKKLLAPLFFFFETDKRTAGHDNSSTASTNPLVIIIKKLVQV